MRSRIIIALGLIGLGLLGGCSGGGDTALSTVPTAHLAITLPAMTTTAGTAFTFTVNALDGMGAIVPTYTGTVHITTSDTAAKLPADAVLAQGVGTFTVTFNTTGNQTITASDTVGDAISGTSSAVSVQPIPVPTIASLSPAITAAGSVGFTLTVNGSNFVLTSVVQWNGSNRSTAFVSSSQLTAQITAADIAAAAAATITVFNPAPGGGSSNLATFTITTAPGPTIIGLSPGCAPAGEQLINGVNNQLTVVGPYPTSPGFVAGSVVRWNGSDRPTTSNGTVNGLTAQISASDIAAAGTAVVTVFNPGPGGGLSNPLTFTITTGAVDPQSIAVDPTGKFAYVLDGGCAGGIGGYLSMYTINPATRALASIGPPLWTYDGDTPGSMAVDPSGKFVYVANPGDPYSPDAGSVSMYSIDATTGALTYTGMLSGNCPGLCFPASVAVDPFGKFAYVASGGGAFPFNVEMYTIDPTTGALNSIGTIAAGGYPQAVAVDPAGNFLFMATMNATPGSAGSVSTYAINATTGALTSIGTITAGGVPNAVTVDPSGKFAYVPNSGSNDVSMYTIDATTGALTSIGTTATGTGPVAVAVDPSGKFAYVADSGSNDVSMYTINSTTGSLTLTGMIAAGSSPSSIAIDPSGEFAYVTNSGSNDVAMYSIGATGTLTLIGTIGT